jgi:hypothetical protein
MLVVPFLGVKRPGRTADHLQLVQGLRMSGAVLPSAHTSSCCLYRQIFIVLAPQWHGTSSGCGCWRRRWILKKCDSVARFKFDFRHRQTGRCIGHDIGLSGLIKCGQHLEQLITYCSLNATVAQSKNCYLKLILRLN